VYNLKDKTVLITGASSGIGKACAFEFAKAGARLILISRRIEKLNEFTPELKKLSSSEVLNIKLDVRKNDEVEKVISELPENWKQIDILLNNAGLARGLSKIQEGNIKDWEEMIDTNVKGLLYMTRQIAPMMTSRGKGHIINIGSIAGHEVYQMGNVYCATKFAVKALTKGMRIDLLDKNIRVTTIDPGMVETEFSIVRFSGDAERAKKVYEGVKPLSPDDVAESVLYCATRPAHVNINELIIMPTIQASTTHIIRE
jgi:NADP-dependent 3-hydroxy acid dehydrogenase YdfG